MPLETNTSVASPSRPLLAAEHQRASVIAIVIAWLATLAWAATIYWFSSRTGPEIEEINVFELSDKAAHFIAFFAGGPAIVCALRWSTNWDWARIAVVGACILVLYGAADEYHQTFTVNRTGADFWDGLADALGGIAGTMATIFLYVRIERFRSPRRSAP